MEFSPKVDSGRASKPVHNTTASSMRAYQRRSVGVPDIQGRPGRHQEMAAIGRPRYDLKHQRKAGPRPPLHPIFSFPHQARIGALQPVVASCACFFSTRGRLT
jgi:hypothetical protein